MNKTAIKNFAIWARNKLIADVSYKAGLLGITDKEIHKPAQVTQGIEFYSIDRSGALQYEVKGKEIEQRRHLADKITEKARQSDYATAYKAVIEEVAYTWFNRLIAVRFMEVNDYLPSRVRVLSSQSSVVSGTAKSEPDIVTRPFDTDLEFTAAEREYVIACKTDNKLNELFRMLFIKQCNALNALLPELFERIGDYTELLLNISFTDKDGVVWRLISDITEADFGEAVEIIGWLYQYYNTEPKDETFALLKKNVKITKERIPAATQLFTPDWIVRYMVENSLGRIFVNYQLSELSFQNETERIAKEKEIADKMGWKYYLPEAEQTPEVRAQLITANCKLKTEWNVEGITFLDPCMGSGHILVYAFDVFMQIYESAGYSQRDAVRLILEKNIHGLDIDRRAYQLAYFSLMMKARQYNRRIFTLDVRPQVYYPGGFAEGEEYGSLLKIDELCKQPEQPAGQMTLLDDYDRDLRIWNFQRLLSMKYDVVVTNPPYMGGSGMSGKLSEFVKREYADSKSDLFACFIEQCGMLTKQNGFTAMITQHAWMFLSSYEKLRVKLQQRNIVNMAHHGARAFAEIGGEVVQSTAFVMRSGHIGGYKGVFVCLFDIGDAEGKEREFLSSEHRHVADGDDFAKIPGSPVAYWANEALFKCFVDFKSIGNYFHVRNGITTGDNSLFLRLWHEISPNAEKWYSLNKGGAFRKWNGNREYVIDWENDGHRLKHFTDNNGRLRATLRGIDFNFNAGITMSRVTSGEASFRIMYGDSLSESATNALYPMNKSESDILFSLGMLNSKPVAFILNLMNPTLNIVPEDIRGLPISLQHMERVKGIVASSVNISRTDWDSFETSWDFKRHPLV